MKIVLFLGTLIIFISCFFIFFTFDSMLRSELVCSFKERFVCNVNELNSTIVFGILVVGMFIFVDGLVVYVMVKTWVPDLFAYG
jgi:hypothetical protein